MATKFVTVHVQADEAKKGEDAVVNSMKLPEGHWLIGQFQTDALGGKFFKVTVDEAEVEAPPKPAPAPVAPKPSAPTS